jgi:predicted ATPase
VHELPNVKKEQVAHLPGIILHQGFRSVSDLVTRFNRYTDLDAQQAYQDGVRFSWLRLLLKPPAKFLQQYLYCGLCHKGLAGIAAAALWSYYIFLREIKLYDVDWQINQQSSFRDAQKHKKDCKSFFL